MHVSMMQRLWLAVVACLFMPTASLAAAVSPIVRVSGPSPFKTCAVGASPHQKGFAYTNAEVEPSIAVNPRTVGTSHENIIGVWQQDRLSSEAARGLVAGYSFDGGTTWSETPLPFSSCATPTSPETSASDPWVSIGPDGTAYASTIAVGPALNAIITATSTDGGRTWGRAVRVLEELNTIAYNDKPSITADPTQSGRAYLVWDRNPSGQNTPQPTWFSVTTDSGRTWSPARRITFQIAPGTGTLGDQILVDSRRHVMYDVFERFVQIPRYQRVCTRENAHTTCKTVSRHVRVGATHDVLGFIRSRDEGMTWSRPTNIVADRGIDVKGGGAILRTGFTIPEPALDPRSGRVYVAWEDARFSKGRFQGIALISSDDGGRHWSHPLRVNGESRHAAFDPAVAVGPTGIVGLIYVSLRTGGLPKRPLLADYWFISSSDHGRHFSRPRHLKGPFNMRTAPNSSGLFLGDYQSLTADGRLFRPFFVATNSGNLTNRTDVFTTTIAP